MTHTIPAPKDTALGSSPSEPATRSSSTRATRGRWRDRAADPIFNVLAVGMLLVAIVVILYPLYFILIASVSEPSEILNGNVALLTHLWAR